MKSIIDYRKILIIVFAIFFGALYLWSNHQLTTVCVMDNCSSTTMLGFWYPLQTFGVVGVIFLIPFLLIPFHYFISWLRYVAWWLIPVGAVIVYNTPPMRSFWFDRDDTVIIMGIFAGLLTTGYLIYLRFKSKIDTQF
jgi:hypothetical protein